MINGVKIIDLPTAVDDRGSLTEIIRWYRPNPHDFYHAEPNEPHSVAEQIHQVYLVDSPLAGTIRAFHRHQKLVDYFSIINGAAKFILVEGDQQYPDKAIVSTIILSDKKPQLLVVPVNIWHGWKALTNNTRLLSIASECYNKQFPDESRIPYYTFGLDIWETKFR